LHDFFFPLSAVDIQEFEGSRFALEFGSSVSLECRADGVPLPDITWLKDGELILASSDEDKYQITRRVVPEGIRPQFSESVISVLNITAVSPSDSGNYTCKAFNSFGSRRQLLPYILSVSSQDFCTPNPCKSGAECSSGLSSFSCDCPEGFTGVTCNTS